MTHPFLREGLCPGRGTIGSKSLLGERYLSCARF